MQKRANLLLIIFILISISTLFGVELNIKPVQTEISEEIEDPRYETVLPAIDLLITPQYTLNDFSFITPVFERLNTGKLVLNTPLKIDSIIGSCYSGAYEEFGNCWSFTQEGEKIVRDMDEFNESKSEWNDILYEIRNGEMSKTELVNMIFEKCGNQEEDAFVYRSINLDKRRENNYSMDMEGNIGQSGNYFINPTTLRMENIQNDTVYLILVNNICCDSININNIEAEEVFIFNYGCNITIQKLRAEEKVRIYNFNGNIEIGNRLAPKNIDATVSVQLLSDNGEFGFKEDGGETAINNKDAENIFFKWNDDEYSLFSADGAKKQLIQLPLMTTSQALFSIKLDLSQNWYEFPAGAEYRGTLYFTVESISN